MKIKHPSQPDDRNGATSRRGLLTLGALAIGGAAFVARPARAAENRLIEIRIRNNSSSKLSLSGGGLSWGKWSTSPPTQIQPGATGFIKAEGREGTLTGCQGNLTYAFDDGQTRFTINFDVPYSAANSGSVTFNGPGVGRWNVNETGSDYVTPVPFQTHGNYVFMWVGVSNA